MKEDEIINEVKIDNLYRHVRNLEGVRHPIDALENLNLAADYFNQKLKEFGLIVREQDFKIGDFPPTFRNIEGSNCKETEPSIILVSHYDTVWNSPGANDNASSNALMLEIARVLASENIKGNFRFLFSTLEEWHPLIELKYRELAQKHGIIDDELNFTSYAYKQFYEKFSTIFNKYQASGKSFVKIMSKTLKKLRGELPEPAIKFMSEYQYLYPNKSALDLFGETNLIGSHKWVEEALSLGKKIKMALCFDELGTVIKKSHSQQIPSSLSKDIFELYNVDIENELGDFIFILASAEVKNVGDKLRGFCKSDLINLSHAYFSNIFSVNELFQFSRGLLGSDHTNFLKAGIPAIFFTDTDGERNPYHHTPADTIDKIDFEQVSKLCKAVLSTLVSLEEN